MNGVEIPLGFAAGYAGACVAAAIGLDRLANRTARTGPLGRPTDDEPGWPHLDAAHFERAIGLVAAVTGVLIATLTVVLNPTVLNVLVLTPLAPVAVLAAVHLGGRLRDPAASHPRVASGNASSSPADS